MVLGSYPTMSLSKAHQALADAKDKLREGVDPGAVATEKKEAERNAETMADMAAEYIERHAKPTMKASTATEDERILNREVLPFIGKAKAKDVTRQRLFLETLEEVYSNTNKVIIEPNSGGGGTGVVPYLPLPEIRKRSQTNSTSNARSQ